MAGKIPKEAPSPPPKPLDWRQQLDRHQPFFSGVSGGGRQPERPRQLFYCLTGYDRYQDSHEIEFWIREKKRDGQWGVLKLANLESDVLADLPREELTLVRRLHKAQRDTWSSVRGNFRMRKVDLRAQVLAMMMPALAATGRFGRLRELGRDRVFEPLAWDRGGPWRLVFEGRDAGGDLELVPRLRRGDGEQLELEGIEIMTSGVFRKDGLLAPLEDGSPEGWLLSLMKAPAIRVPQAEVVEALTRLEATVAPAVELDPAWQERIQGAPPSPALRLELAPGGAAPRVQLLFVYGETEIAAGDSRDLLLGSEVGHPIRRLRPAEQGFIARLPFELDGEGRGAPSYEVLAPLIEELAAEGWRIGTAAAPVRTGGVFRARLQSGIDWFDLEGALGFGDVEARLPELLEAAARGERWVNLSDGTLGLLPAGWLERWAALGRLGRQRQGLRFGRGQALMLHSVLEEGSVQVDEVFLRIREKLRTFDRLEMAEAPPGFLGELRPYQKLGVAWLDLLADLELGGCLADDMGLGKTVQVLAWLLRRKLLGHQAMRPTLLVVPKSLVFNWLAELQRFTPGLSAMVSHGSGRESGHERIPEHDVVITTYGTLVRDIEKLREIEFGVVVLDEAQAIKNRNTQTAEACCQLRAARRLALTGTPVENHLGELWSIFEFLNPGLLGSLPRISEYAGKNWLPPNALAEVARALRPLILRRRKAEVLKELPEKTEQTLVCELGPAERKHYDSLRNYYRASLKSKIEEVGLSKAKIWVLEALLRLRQAACHRGLIDQRIRKQSSAKLDILLENLTQVLAEGHKAIVFSQFTTLLGLLRHQLDERGWTYEYLDGRTRDRAARVARFQTAPEVRLFLVSLKAGGLGLNLTAASYVFLLDPWWNPAVESQAIDRAHRIGQHQPVFAYRIIAADTVEEKILKLQEEKRALAEAIVAEDSRVLKQLTAADLEQLLG